MLSNTDWRLQTLHEAPSLKLLFYSCGFYDHNCDNRHFKNFDGAAKVIADIDHFFYRVLLMHTLLLLFFIMNAHKPHR